MSAGNLDGTLYTYVETFEELEAFFRWLSQPRRVLAIDTETKGLKYWAHDQFIRLVQFGDTQQGWTLSTRLWRGAIEHTLNTYTGQITFHNMSFDLKALRSDGYRELPLHKLDDTFMMTKLLVPDRRAGLKYLGEKLIDRRAGVGSLLLDDAFRKQGFKPGSEEGWLGIDERTPEYSLYAALDVVLTARLWEMFTPEMPTLAHAYDTEMTYRSVMDKCEYRGLPIDLEYTQRLYDKWTTGIDTLTAKLALQGITKPGTPNQIIDALLEEGWEPEKFTNTGKVATDRKVLEALPYPVVQDLLSYRRLTKWRKSYLEPFLDSGGRIHPTINTFEARTGRSSVSNPPLQQLPKKYRVRRCIQAEEGTKYYAADFDGQEFRLAISSAGEHDIAKAMIAGIDGHKMTASLVFGTPIDEVTPQQRALSKTISYCKIYGGGLSKIASTAGIDEDSAKEFVTKFDRALPKLKAYTSRTMEEARRSIAETSVGYTRLPEGRRAALDGFEHKALNTEIQGTGAIVMKQAVNKLSAMGFEDYITLTIHDEALFSLPDDKDALDIAREAAAIMEDHSYLVPLTTDIKGPADTWGNLYEMEEDDF